MLLKNAFIKNKFFIIVSAIFIVWAALYIFKSSFVAVDGRRYFMLFDDAMISMRFAWNYAHGLGLVWNAGEYVQGYTNLLMTLIMSVSSLFLSKQYAVLMIQILGIPTVLAIALISVKISQKYDRVYSNKDKDYKLIFVCVLLYYPIVYWSLMGMETGLLSILLLLSILFSLRYIDNPDSKYFFVIAVLMGLAFMTRNESAIFAGVIFLYVCFNLIRKKLIFKKFFYVLFATLIYFNFIIGQLLFQYFYYGEWLPNTYVLKLTGMSFSDRVINGIGFIKPFLFYTSPLILLSIACLVKKFSLNGLYLISFPIISIIYQVYVGGDPWLYWRIMAPTMPLLIILFVLSVDAFFSAKSVKSRLTFFANFRQQYLVPILVIGCIFIFANRSENSAFLKEMTLIWKPYQSDIAADNVNMALILDQLTNPDATVGVYWAGSMPYYLDRRVIDFFGKSDKYIARLPPDMSGSRGWNGMNSVPGHNKYDLQYSLVKLQPTFVPGFSMGLQDFSEWGAQNYQKVTAYWYSFYLKKEAKEVNWSSVK